ncbi:pre-peptidase C-terminal domain-containing protein [Oculatella sp. LEGE 06141]|uniref:cadherin-like domain-containing protein n=1 Tax=Oculatella sp. LEGE 06141 TaxID=1828648 RepID=UPI00187F69CF|nr:cadherin-like domain-containing protein [Oculatella sp. LEGE 06141]MBE9178355.1 pre-peptidase C-terminal domain-containing protein [Oculatella sp. LEGE 06141]
MAQDPGNRRGTAQPIRISTQPQVLVDSIGGRDKFDFYRFKLNRPGNIRAALNGLKTNADLALTNARGKILHQSNRPGKRKELLTAELNRGTYYLRVRGRGGNTRYRLRLGFNTPPRLAINTGMAIGKGKTASFGQRLLRVTDREQDAKKLVYTLTNQPQNGRLQLNGKAIAAGSQFSQEDVDKGRLKYKSLPDRTRLVRTSREIRSFEVSGSNIVWAASDGNDFEIYHSDGNTTTQLTNNEFDDFAPKISGSNVVWQGFDGNDYEIFFHNGSSTIQLTNNGFDDIAPQISGSNVVWSGFDGNDYEIFYFNGSSTTQLTNNGADDASPQISGSNVVWAGFDGNDYEIYRYDGSTIVPLTNNNQNDFSPQISGSNTVWTSFDGKDFELFFNNGINTVQLTDNNRNDVSPHISGNNIVWLGTEGVKQEIYYYNGSSIEQLTSSATTKLSPIISGSSIVWQGFSNGNSEIYYYNGSGIEQLTNNRAGDVLPKMSGPNLVWQSQQGNTNELIYRNLATTDSFSFVVADRAGGKTDGTVNITIG